jgi:hypothetical protein
MPEDYGQIATTGTIEWLVKNIAAPKSMSSLREKRIAGSW